MDWLIALCNGSLFDPKIFAYIVLAIGLLNALSILLEAIAKRTPNTEDDRVALALQKVVNVLRTIVDFFIAKRR